ncbi:hypothetical protein [Algoriphagus sediminis]|uniref:Beta-carotene 15,15'-monooxygenase n=1 Tax=Algoriphagus sediminis TaxID=3057113 RepID=A0ABT7YBJ8_9BACT|nr:hypothetical protein [Algoriphagus sediminis]MDN3203905.1 hypothetical protein [Algoriphagus sediminis]
MSLFLRRSHPIILLFLAGLFFFFLVRTEQFPPNADLLSLGITFDLVVLIPGLFFFTIRKTKLPKTLVLPVLLAGVILASYILPEGNQRYLDFAKSWLVPLAELAVISYVVWKVTNTVRVYKETQKGNTDFFNALKDTCRKLFPPFAVNGVATEVAVFYYGFFKWKSPKLGDNEFSYHKDSPSRIILAFLIFLIIAETFVFHILLMNWSLLAAWILTGLSIYSGFQLFGVLRSLNQRPIYLSKDTLHLRYGFASEVDIPFDQINRVEKFTADFDEHELSRRLSILGTLEAHNVTLELKVPAELSGIYGIKRRFQTLAFFVDDPDRFVEVISEHTNNL